MDATHHPVLTLLVQVAAVVGVSRAFAMVARRAEQPVVVAEIAAGIALGPSLLGRFWPEASGWLFPAGSIQPLGLLSQLGLVLFLFLVGLEFDEVLVRGRGRAAVVVSHASIVVPFLMGMGLARWLYPGLARPSVPFLPFALFLGIAMSITAFPVLARMLSERKLAHTELGTMALACAAVDDVTAWCLLSFVVAITRASGAAGAALTAVLAIGYVAVLLGVVRPLVGRFTVRALRAKGPREDDVAWLLVFALSSAAVTELIGIHALFGAFAFGVIVPNTGGFARAVAARLERVVVVLLLPLFFAYSGLRTEVGLLGGASDLGVCMAILGVACLGKLGGSFFAARFVGMPPREALSLGVLMNTRGLMELVVLNVGLELGVISAKLFTMMVIMALVTTGMTGPLLRRTLRRAEEERDGAVASGIRRAA